MAKNGLKQLGIGKNVCKWLEMAGNGWKSLKAEMDGNG